jgi:hypothetical protein
VVTCRGAAVEHAKKIICDGGFAGEIQGRYVRDDGRDWEMPRKDWLHPETFDWEMSTTCGCSSWPLAEHMKDFGYVVAIRIDRETLESYLEDGPEPLSLDGLKRFLAAHPHLVRKKQLELAVRRLGPVPDKLWREATKSDPRPRGRRRKELR